MGMTSASSRPSRTARVVALGRAAGWRGLRDPLARRFLTRPEQVLVDLVHAADALPVAGAAVAVASAGLTVHASLRMAAIDRAVTDAAEDGCAQAVIVGAGYDTRAWRLPALTGRRVFEVDLPAIQAIKRTRLRDRSPVADITFVPADLAQQSLPDTLSDVGFDARRPTVWVWEAVTPYLSDDAVRATAGAIADCSAAGSRLVMTFAHPIGGPTVLQPLVSAVVSVGFRVLGEPLRSSYDDWDLLALLDQAGFTDPRVSTPRQWAFDEGRTMPPDPFIVERLVVATRR